MTSYKSCQTVPELIIFTDIGHRQTVQVSSIAVLADPLRAGTDPGLAFVIREAPVVGSMTMERVVSLHVMSQISART